MSRNAATVRRWSTAGVRVSAAVAVVSRAIGAPALIEAALLAITTGPAGSAAVPDAAARRCRAARAALARARAAVVRPAATRAS